MSPPEPELAWHVYIVRCSRGSLYTGIATDVARRFAEHGSDGARGAKYLRGKGPLELVFQRSIGPRGLAQRVESRIKRLSKARKEALIRGTDIEPLLAEDGSA